MPTAAFTEIDGVLHASAHGAHALFTGRAGGVSAPPFDGLNLGPRTGDQPGALAENRRLVEAMASRDGQARELLIGTQVHESSVAAHLEGYPEVNVDGVDAHVTDRRDLAIAVLTADCIPVALLAPWGVGVAHAGWRGLAGGVIGGTVGELLSIGDDGASAARISAFIGPCAGACCYEVGDEVHAAFLGWPGTIRARPPWTSPRWPPPRSSTRAWGRSTSPGAARSATSGTSVTAPAAARPAARPGSRGGHDRSDPSGAPSPEHGRRGRRRRSSHRAARGPGRRRQRRRPAPGAGGARRLQVLRARGDPALVQAGATLLGENRADVLAAKQATVPAGSVQWDYIGELQSRKVKDLAPQVSRIHTLASESAVRRLHALAESGAAVPELLVQVNVAGEEGKGGVAPTELPALLEAAAGLPVRGLMTMPPLATGPDDSRTWFGALRELAEQHGLTQLSMGTSQDALVAAAEGATVVRVGGLLTSGDAWQRLFPAR